MPSIGQQLLLQLILILINAFFAATEIAVISLNENKLRHQADEGDKRAKKMLKMVEEPERFLSTIQIGITLAGFLGSAFAADNFSGTIVTWMVETVKITAIPISVLKTISVVAVTIILSYFTLILGELVPKRIAMKKSEQLARAVSGIIGILSTILKPVNWFMSVSTNGVLRLLGINPKDDEKSVSEDEIRMMIDIGEENGTIAPNEKEMIENIFEFNNQTAGEIMVHRTDMTVLWEDNTPEEIVNTIMESGYSRFPVCGADTDEIVGILRTREYLLNMRDEHPKALKELLSPAYFVPKTVRADVLFRDMQSKKCHMAIVVDEYGGTNGLLTMEDLIEEIVGNIYDESDKKAEQDIIKLDDNLWRISGTAALEDVEEALDIVIDNEDEEYGTLGGLIFSQLSQIPEDGSQPEVTVQGLNIKVDEILDRRVEWAIVSKVPNDEESDDDDDKSKHD